MRVLLLSSNVVFEHRYLCPDVDIEQCVWIFISGNKAPDGTSLARAFEANADAHTNTQVLATASFA